MLSPSKLFVVPLLLLAVSARADITIQSMGTSAAGEPILPQTISADGSVVLGRAFVAHSTAVVGDRAVLWTRNGGTQELSGIFGLSSSYPDAISGDGSVVAVSHQGTAFTWSPSSGVRPFAPLPGDSTVYIAGLSFDGNTVLGGSSAGGPHRAMLRHADGSTQIIAPEGTAAYQVVPWGMSADGTYVVGWADLDYPSTAFRWSQSGGFVTLPAFPGQFNANALGISPDGSVTVGFSNSPTGSRAVRWLGTGAAEDLGSLPNSGDYAAFGASTDGGIIVGNAWDLAGGDSYPWFWTETLGMTNLQSFLANAGLDMSQIRLFGAPAGVSADGQTLAVQGQYEYAPGQFRNEGWVVTIPTPAVTWIVVGVGTIAHQRRRRTNSSSFGPVPGR